MHSVLNNSKGLIGKPAGRGGGKADGGGRRTGVLRGVRLGSSETGIRRAPGACFSQVPLGLSQVGLDLLTFAISLVKNSLGVFGGHTVCEELKNIYFLTLSFSRKKDSVQ